MVENCFREPLFLLEALLRMRNKLLATVREMVGWDKAGGRFRYVCVGNSPLMLSAYLASARARQPMARIFAPPWLPLVA